MDLGGGHFFRAVQCSAGAVLCSAIYCSAVQVTLSNSGLGFLTPVLYVTKLHKTTIHYNTMHSVETCGRSYISAQHIFKQCFGKRFKNEFAKFVVHIGKHLFNKHNKNCRSRKISRN